MSGLDWEGESTEIRRLPGEGKWRIVGGKLLGIVNLEEYYS